MAEIVENLVLEILRCLQSDMADVKTRRDRIEFRLGLLEQGQATILSLLASDRPARGE